MSRIFERLHRVCPQETVRSPGLGSLIFLPVPLEEMIPILVLEI
jgi:hypothetical protein